MGGNVGGGDPSGGGGIGAAINNNPTLARAAQAIPGLGGILGQMGYTGPSGPQQPLGTSNLTPEQQAAAQRSGMADVTKLGQNMMAGGGITGGAPPPMGAAPKMAALQLPQPYAPQVSPMGAISSPYGGGAAPGGAPSWGNTMGAGGTNPQFFPFFRR